MKYYIVSLAASLLVCAFAIPWTFAQNPNLVLNDQTASAVGQTVTFTVRIENAPTQLQAFAFDVVFDPTVLQFATEADGSAAAGSIVPGALIGDLTGLFDAGMTEDGRITLAIVTVTGDNMLGAIPAGASGVLLQLRFTVLSLTTSTLTLENPVDDLAQPGWVLGEGMFSEGEEGLRGDCNGDGVRGAGDISAIVLEIFDGDGTVPEDTPGGDFNFDPVGCDANGDGTIGAGDISCIILLIFGNTCG